MNWLSSRLRAAGVCAGIFAAASSAAADQTISPLSIEWPPPPPTQTMPVAQTTAPATSPPAHPSLQPAALSFAPQPTAPAIPQLSPSVLEACACGCGVFDVATSSMLPQGTGGVLWFEYDYQNQNRNWHGDSSAPGSQNGDKAIRTDFFKVGLQYLFTRSWGIEAQVPFARRYFRSEDGADLSSTEWTTIGDISLKGLYTGFFDDQSLGVNFGVKLPTGDFTHDGADRDTQLGSGSTDFLFGGYYRTHLTPDQKWDAFFQLAADVPALIRDDYRPGLEVDAAAGIYYNGFAIQDLQIVPIAQIIGSERTSDSGANSAHPVASGYQRLLLSPGIEFRFHQFSVYGDVELPVFQHMTGDQLVAPALFKLIVAYNF